MVDTYAGLTAEQQTFYNQTVLDRAMPSLWHHMFGLKYKVPKNGGMDANWRRPERPASNTTALSEGSSGAATTITVSNIVASILQYGQWMQGTDVLADQAIDNIPDTYHDIMGEMMGITADTIVRNAITGGSNVQYASTAGSRGGVASGMILNAAELIQARRTLQTNNARGVPEAGGNYACIMSTDTEADWLRDPTYIAAQQFAGPRDDTNVLVTGKLRPYFGISFFVTSQGRVVASAGNSVSVYLTMLIAKGAYGVSELDAQQAQVIFKDRGTSGINDPLNQLWTLGYKFTNATAILNQNWMVRIEHCVS